jgi:hypothetical protein
MVLRKTVCLKQLGDDRGDELGAGRLFANDKVTSERIVESWSERTTLAVAGRHVLAIQDMRRSNTPPRPIAAAASASAVTATRMVCWCMRCWRSTPTAGHAWA